jgi:hypothetical protein
MTDSSVYELTDGETPLVNLNRSPQDHTFPGKRGDTLVEGVTYRDVYEAVQVGINRAAGESDDNDVFNINMDDLDPVAIAQNTCVNVEQRQGIYPNVANLEVIMNTKEIVASLNKQNADRENRLVQVARDYDETFAEEPVTLDRMEEI